MGSTWGWAGGPKLYKHMAASYAELYANVSSEWDLKSEGAQ